VRFGRPHRHFRRTDSTNSRARELAAAGAPGGTVVTADEQTAGRGRRGRSWTAPAGRALLYSAIVRPLGPDHMLLPLAAAVAACEAAEALEDGIECAIKWPNDVWVDDRKLAGILIEARPEDGWAVIGVGINLAIAPEEFPPELRETATSLRAGVSGGDARRALDQGLDRWVEADAETVLSAWAARDALRGREISWDGGSGVADGVSDSGDLLVLTAGGDRVALGAGEVHLSL
jgi:BirA family transcriptional regulator, biotin operon repressor / biotin---[acetyl-CoA-carboxylase] ligase